MKYQPPYGVNDPDAPYINGDPSIGRQGSIIPAGAVEYPQRELVTTIEAAKMTPDDASLSQLLYAIRGQRMNYALAINTDPDVVAVEFDPPIGNTMTPGMPLRIKGIVNNTGPTLLSVDAVEHPLRYADGAELLADDIKSGVIFEAIWNDTGFWEFNPYAAGGAGGGSSTNTFINIPFAVDTGVPNSLVANFVPAITALSPGLTVEVRVINDITGPSQVKVNALAPVPILRGNGQPLESGDAVTGQIMLLIYSSQTGAFQFSGLIPKAASGLGPPGTIVLACGNAAIPGTLKLNGALLQRSEHPLLWSFANASGRIVNEVDWQNVAQRYWTAFSRGDGVATFRIPDFRGEFMRFFDDARGVDASRVLGVQQVDIVGALAMSGNIDLINPKLTMGAFNHGPRPIPGNDPYDRNLELMTRAGALTGSNFEVSGNIQNVYDDPKYNWPSWEYVGQPSSVPTGGEEAMWVNGPKIPSGSPGYIYQPHVDSRITSLIALNGSGGGNETRPRNAAVMPCIVDG
jgi:hypothetical protein